MSIGLIFIVLPTFHYKVSLNHPQVSLDLSRFGVVGNEWEPIHYTQIALNCEKGLFFLTRQTDIKAVNWLVGNNWCPKINVLFPRLLTIHYNAPTKVK